MTVDANRRKIIDQIIKLNALADGSSFGEEAETARKMAAKLMLKHDLSMGEIKGTDDFVKVTEDSGKTNDKWAMELMWAIADFNGLYVLRQRGNRRWGLNMHFILWGRQCDIDNALYMHDILLRQLNDGLKKKRKEVRQQFNRKIDRSELNGFRVGFINAIRDRLHDMMKKVDEARQEAGLVPTNYYKQLAVAAKGSYSGKVKNIRSRGVTIDRAARDAGAAAGRAASITKGISGKKDKTLRLGC